MLKTPLTINESPNAIANFLSNLQGNILKDHGRQYLRLILFRIDEANAIEANRWLKNLPITSAWEQYQATLRKKAGGKGDEFFRLIAFSGKGYQKLQPAAQILQDQKFVAGMGAEEARIRLGDPDQAQWEPKYREHREHIDALLLIAHADQDELKIETDQIIKEINQFGSVLIVEEGEKIPKVFNGKQEWVEPFGYVDGISQPLFFKDEVDQEIQDKSIETNHWKAKAELKLVLQKEHAEHENYGSFLVYRKLKQDVEKFNDSVLNLANALGISQDQAGAYALGRNQDGTPLIQNPTPQGQISRNDFTFANDPNGNICPRHAHIRKTNPRNSNHKHLRIVRRGIPYSYENETGLLFLSFQANLEAFETLQGDWANNENFPVSNTGVDAIIGTKQNSISQIWPSQIPQIQIPAMANFVTLQGGEYFFTPSISFLKNL